MPYFNATYVNRTGQNRQIRLQADNAASARRDLRRRGIIATSLEIAQGRERGTSNATSQSATGHPNQQDINLKSLLEAKPGIREKALFANKLAALVDAGVPIVRSLDLMAKQQTMPLFKRALTAVSTEVNQGGGLGAALRRWPKVFDKLTIAMVEAGETGGVLDESLRRLASLLEGNARLQNQIKGAMGYPIAVLVIAILVFLGMTIFLIPIFADIFKDLGAELPLFTQIMINISGLLRSSFSIFAVLTIAVSAWVFKRYYATPTGRRKIDAIILKLPLFGDLIQKTATAKFCRTFSSLARAGVPILVSLEITQEIAGNTIISDAIMESRKSIQEGIPLSIALSRRKVFPELALSMLAIGEETGQMDSMLSKVADFYEDEVGAAVKALTSMLEPAMIVIVGGIVGSILMAMYLPMFSVFDQIK